MAVKIYLPAYIPDVYKMRLNRIKYDSNAIWDIFQRRRTP